MTILLDNPVATAAAVLALAGLFLAIYVLARLRKLAAAQKELWAGEDTPDLEQLLLKHKKELSSLKKNLREIGGILSELVEDGKFNIQRVGLVRFNPFDDTGSDLSFSLALLDGSDSGVVVSSLHGRQGTRIYGKRIEKGAARQMLTDEEKEAIRQAGN